MGRRRVFWYLSSVFVAICLACNSSKSIRGDPYADAHSDPTPTLSRVTVGGNVQLTEVGATAQLSATALYTDSSTKDVTQEASWSTGDPTVLTVSAGLVRAVAFGQTFITANYQNRNAGVSVRATPAGTFIVTGGVREPGQGWMNNVEVVETISGRSTTTRNGGGFAFAAITTQTVRLAVRRDSYEAIEVEVPTNASPSFMDLPIQKIIRFAAGDKVTPPSPLAENDLAYTVGTAKWEPVPADAVRHGKPRNGHVQNHLAGFPAFDVVCRWSGRRVRNAARCRDSVQRCRRTHPVFGVDGA